MVEDGLTRTFIPTKLLRKVNEADSSEVPEKFRVSQRVAAAGRRIGHVGDIIKITPWDKFGRRTVTMSIEGGAVIDVIQGITIITPLWTKVDGLMGQNPFVWDSRLATSSIPREILNEIMRHQINPKDLDQRLKIVRLFINSDRYQDAKVELEGIVRDFPQEENLKQLIRELRQKHARRILDEIKQRGDVGQHRLAYTLLENFPKDDIAGETLQQIREMIDRYTNERDKYLAALSQIEATKNEIKDETTRKRCQVVYDELQQELNINTFDRMAAFNRLADDKSLSADDKFALAVSGWLLGSDDAVTNLAVALSMYDVRNLVRQYLNEPLKLRRADILQQIKSQEGGVPRLVAGIVAHMKPPVKTRTPQAAANDEPPVDKTAEKPADKAAVKPGEKPSDKSTDKPNDKAAGKEGAKEVDKEGDKPADPPAVAVEHSGYFELSVPGIDKEPPVSYFVQLPPEYDPYRRYPTVVTLNGAGTTPQQQVDWWCGGWDAHGNRQGQAIRHGYIVVAVEWAKPGQREYEYSAREHAAILTSLRDATRRFAIDTDRVYLSGHSMGGDAAWDLGDSHPDLWAGVIPIVAKAEKYSAFYEPNASLGHFYFVGGEYDGDKTVKNAPVLDKYLSHHYDVTVVEYLGRGHEHFHDEIQRIFDWMGRRTRNFFPRSFSVSSMRTWDNYFWWVELDGYPAKAVIEPSDWPPTRGYQPVRLTAKLKGTTFAISTGANKVSVWLSPELIDLEQPFRITVNETKLKTPKGINGPDLATLLEDVRTRGERLHPFWLKIE